ncbi:hypothetical protein BJI48_00935 [Helicobacter sp. 11S02596-1]|nr:hypothetical protein BJI48_00935 [Helicobacter sp. 11S02596-1]
MVALIAFAQKYYHASITINQLMTCQTIQDICMLIKESAGGGGRLTISHTSLWHFYPPYLLSLYPTNSVQSPLIATPITKNVA